MVFGLDILQDWPAPKKIYDILIGFVQRNKLRKKLFWETIALGSNFAKTKTNFENWFLLKWSIFTPNSVSYVLLSKLNH